jgi:hypothetical protein
MLKIKEAPLNNRLYRKIEKINKDYLKAINLGFLAIGDMLKREVIFDLDDWPSKTGRSYLIEKDGYVWWHRASAPGQPPATMFGNLSKTIKSRVRGPYEMTLGAGSSKVTYAVDLELGTPKVEARPYLSKVIFQKERDTENYFRYYLIKKVGQL